MKIVYDMERMLKMRQLRKAASLILAVWMAAAGTILPVAAKASGKQGIAQYKATELAMPKVTFDNKTSVESFSKNSAGIDLLLNRRGPDGKAKFIRYHTSDDGKSWSEEELKWLEEAMEKDCEFADDRPWVRMGEDGAVYAMFDMEGHVELPMVGYGYYKGKVIKHQNGTTQEILTLDNPDFTFYAPLGGSLASGKELVLQSWGQGDRLEEYVGREMPDYLMVYDKSTGKQVSKALYQGWPFTYVNGQVYNQDAQDDASLAAIDVRTAKVTKKLPRPEGWENERFSGLFTAGPDGSLYSITAAGLFRLKPVEDSWERLADKSACKLGTAGANLTQCSALFVDQDGTVYVLLRHITDGEFREETKAMTLSCYVPL